MVTLQHPWFIADQRTSELSWLGIPLAKSKSLNSLPLKSPSVNYGLPRTASVAQMHCCHKRRWIREKTAHPPAYLRSMQNPYDENLPGCAACSVIHSSLHEEIDAV